MKKWLQFRYKERAILGVLDEGQIHIYSGELFNDPQPVGETVSIEEVEFLPPCQPSKMLGLWNNFHSRAEHDPRTKVLPPVQIFREPSPV